MEGRVILIADEGVEKGKTEGQGSSGSTIKSHDYSTRMCLGDLVRIRWN